MNERNSVSSVILPVVYYFNSLSFAVPYFCALSRDVLKSTHSVLTLSNCCWMWSNGMIILLLALALQLHGTVISIIIPLFTSSLSHIVFNIIICI